MPSDPDTVLRRLTDRLAPLERDLHRAFWAAATDARPETSAARQRAEATWLAALGDPELFADVQGALAADGAAGAGGQRTRRALEQAGLDLLANQIPEGDRAELVTLQAKVELAFSTRRGRVGDGSWPTTSSSGCWPSPPTRPSGAPPGRPASRSAPWSPTTCWPWPRWIPAWPPASGGRRRPVPMALR